MPSSRSGIPCVKHPHPFTERTLFTWGYWVDTQEGNELLQGMDRLLVDCKPEIIRVPRGWLACTPAGHSYRIGVPGETPEEAASKFEGAVTAWEELHARPMPGMIIGR